MKLKSFLAAALLAGGHLTGAQATPTTFTGAYVQNFDLALTNGVTTLPPGFGALDNSSGSSSAANPTSTSVIAAAAPGASATALLVWNAGAAVTKNGTELFNLGCWDNTNADRALGTDATGVNCTIIELGMTNNTGGILYGVTFSYDCKCLTNGTVKSGYTDVTEATNLPGYTFYYSTTGTNSAAYWTQVGIDGYAATNASSHNLPVANGLCLPNYTEGTTMSSGPVTILFATPLTNNGIMYFRWADNDCPQISPDQMLGIDNISITSYTPAGPVVGITSPVSGAVVAPGSDLAIVASATEAGGTVTNVGFFAGATLLGNVTGTPYSLTWSDVPAGSYALTAVASDSLGLATTSAVVNISVAVTPPTVSLTSPANNASYSTPASIPFAATVTDSSGIVTNVAFYQGSTLLANTSSPYTYTWANVPTASYVLTAVAMDNQGLTATSSVVAVTVGNPTGISFTGSYFENFDEDLTNSSTFVPAGFTSMAIAGSHSDYTANTPFTPAAIASATAQTQSLIVWNAGNAVTKSGTQLYNIGCWDSLNDRALGTDPTGIAGSVMQLVMTNNSGSLLYGVTFSYDCKCLTNGSVGDESAELPGYSFFYSVTGSTSASDWTEVGYAGTTNDPNGLPVAHGLCLPNYTEGTTMSSGPVAIQFASPLTNGGVMYFRWVDDDNIPSSPDQMLAIDNVSVTAFNPSAPTVTITSPTNNANYIPSAGFTIQVNATDAGTNITSVGFYFYSSLEATLTSPAYTNGDVSTYIVPVPGGEVPAGTYPIYVVVTDAAGLTATSSVVTFTVAYVPPTVSLTSPVAGASFPAPASIPLSASAADSNGAGITVTNVAFYNGTTWLGNATTAPFNFTWGNVSAGSYNLTTRATDSLGLSATSSVVAMTVTNGYGLPVVSLTSPVNNANFLPGSSIALAANAAEDGGAGITNVEFYANGTDLGGVAAAPYDLTWPSVPAGAYALTAVAADAAGNAATSSVVNITVSVAHLPPTVSLTSPAPGSVLNVASGLSLAATAASSDGTVTNVAFWMNNLLVANVTAAPYTYNWTNAPSGNYTLTAVATDDSGVASTSTTVNVLTTNSIAIATLQQIKTIFIIPLENHDLVQANPTGSPEQLLGNPACPYFNSLITPGSSNAVQTAWATHYFSSAINGEHPSEPNYIWSEAGTDFGVRTDNDPGNGNTYTNVQHLSAQLTAAGVSWRTYQEDMEYGTGTELVSNSGSDGKTNSYNGTTQYNYAVKHNPMAFFTDTQNKNCYPMTNFWTDLANNNLARYNWITPDQYNEMHSSLPAGYAYNGTAWTGNQAAIAEGDNFLSIAIPQIMASQAYQDHGVIIIWTDETESTDDTNTTLPYVIISPLAKGNAYASTLPYSHSSDLKTMDEIFGLAYQTNALPAGYADAQNTASNYVNGSSAPIYDLSDFFTPLVATHVPPTVSLTSPVGGTSFAAPAHLALSATAADIDGTVTNVAFYAGSTQVGNVTSAPFTVTTANIFAGSYALTAVATDNSGATATSGVVNVTITNTPALAVLQSIKTVFVIAMENHDLVQKNPTGSPQQIEGNPAAPYFNSLITPGNPNAAQTAWATHMFSAAINGEHPSEPNYIWQEAGTDFGIRTDNDPNSPATSHNVYTNVQHLSAQLTTAGIAWRSYQEDMEYSTSEEVSKSGSGYPVNPYNGTTQINYAAKHNPMAFFPDTQNLNCYPMTNFWTDLTNNNIGRYNWITPDQYNEWHSSLSAGYTYFGTNYTGDQAAIAEGDNCLSIIIPKIMASAAYQDHGVIIIWTDETESTDDTNTTLPYVIISPLAKGNAYASTLPYSHSSDLKTMDELFGLAYQTNAIPTAYAGAAYLDAQNTATNYVDGRSATIYDLSDFFQPAGVSVSTQSAVRPAHSPSFQFTFTGPPSQTYEVLATTDLTQPASAWSVVSSGTFIGTNVTYMDTTAAANAARYFIVKSPAP